MKHRRNIALAKVSDESLLVSLLIQAELGITSQRRFYRICHLFFGHNLLERSRHFNRRTKQLIWLVQLIRQALSGAISPDTIVIMDSFPLPLFQPIRNHSAKIVNDVADIGYNAAKNFGAMGLKSICWSLCRGLFSTML